MNKLGLYILVFFIFLWNCSRIDSHHENDHVHSNNVDLEDHVHTTDESQSENIHTEDHKEHCENDSIYGVMKILPTEFSEIIHTSGEILSARSDEISVTAIHDGLILLNDNQLLPGQKVSKKELLFTISGEG